MRGNIFIALAAAALLAGCQTGATGGQALAPATPDGQSGSPALAAIAAAPAGAAQVADDPTLGGAVRIDVLTAYAAASGRSCKRVAIRRQADGAQFSRVACLGPGGWYWTAASIT